MVFTTKNRIEIEDKIIIKRADLEESNYKVIGLGKIYKESIELHTYLSLKTKIKKS